MRSASDDYTVAIWDNLSVKKAKDVISFHKDIVNDTKWHEFDENILGTVSEDISLTLYRKRSVSDPMISIITKSPFNTLAFSKHSNNLFAAAGTDSQIYLYDMRNVLSALHTMVGHQQPVTSREFSPSSDGILCSS